MQRWVIFVPRQTKLSCNFQFELWEVLSAVSSLPSFCLRTDHSWRVCRYKERNLRVHSLWKVSWNSSVWQYIKESLTARMLIRHRGDIKLWTDLNPVLPQSNVGQPTHKDWIYKPAHSYPENEWPSNTQWSDVLLFLENQLSERAMDPSKQLLFMLTGWEKVQNCFLNAAVTRQSSVYIDQRKSWVMTYCINSLGKLVN